MNTQPRTTLRKTAQQVRQRILAGGERIWRFEDFADLPITAVAQALSRLTKEGGIERLSKGTYYRGRPTAFGPSRPNPAALQQRVRGQRGMYPAGLAAANLLGFTTQNPRQGEIATSGSSLPRKLLGRETKIHTRRPEAWRRLTETDAALLDFLRRRGEPSELSPKETSRRVVSLMKEPRRFERLLAVAPFEPPRVRAMLGAIGEELGKKAPALEKLRQSLNPLSRFDFGQLSGLSCALRWFAKGPKSA